MHHIAMFGELPFRPRIPNTETIEAMKELENGGGKTYATSQEMYDDLGI
jgi:antitoxin component of RelBE/YafQ-DinJ toxin-antitoxin module